MDVSGSQRLLRHHGGCSDAELAQLGRVGPITDLSINLNPYAPSELLLDKLQSTPLMRYPEADDRSARLSLAQFFGVPVERIAAGGGAAEILWSLARVLLDSSKSALFVEPTFSEFRLAATACGARVRQVQTCENNGFRVEPEILTTAMEKECPDVLYLCVPNNPTGLMLDREFVAELGRRFGDATVVVDLAFLPLGHLDSLAEWTTCPNTVAVQSLTKVFGVPGIRAAYAAGPEAIMQRLDEVRPPWTLGSHAQTLLESTPDLLAEINEHQPLLRADREAWTAGLSAAQFRVLPTATCFALFEVGGAAHWRRHLLRTHGIAVRDCTSFGLPDWIRTAVPPQPIQQPILEAFAATRAALGAP